MTLEQSTDSSSGSVTSTLKETVSPNLKSVPSFGCWRVTVGAVLPTVTWTEAVPLRPDGSVAVSVAE